MNLPNMFLDDIDYDDSVKSDEIESVIKKVRRLIYTSLYSYG